MSMPLPKRIQELSPLESDGDSKTPQRSFNQSNATKRFYPKRISELSPLSSSDDEADGNLNCAVLNDSGECSPIVDSQTSPRNELQPDSQRVDLESISEGDEENAADQRAIEFDENSASALSTKLPTIVEGDKTKPTLSIFSKILQSSHSKSAPLKPKSPPYTRATPLASSTLTATTGRKFSPFEERLNELCNDAEATKTTSSSSSSATSAASNVVNRSCNDYMRKVESCTKAMGQIEVHDATPLKPFQVPSTKRVLSTHRPMGPSGRRRQPLESEFRSQRILFTTPTAVSRPTIALMSNVTLDDSLNCYKSPSTTLLHDMDEPRRSILRTVENNAGHGRAECKSIENAIMSGPVADIKAKLANKENAIEAPPDCIPKDTGDDGKQVIKINGKDFVVQKRIGQGGSSTVFLATHRDSGQECALKVVDLRGDPSLIEGYIKEVKILATLQDKVNVIRLYEYAIISSEHLLYMVMEVGDTDLRKILQGYKTALPLHTLMSYWHQMLLAVQYIHKKDVIHSDLKPENFLMVNGRLKLIDFGISSNMAVDATSIIKFSQVGTFNYISPETLMDTSTGTSPLSKPNQPKIKISPKSDVWSLGCILYLLIYKKTPFSHITNSYAKMQAITDPNKLIDYPALPHYYPKMLTDMAQLCLVRNPKQRASVADILAFPFDMVIPMEK